MIRIDLHMHSTASDGVFSPSEVVSLALTHSLDVIALTDHDSTNGIPEAQQSAEGTPLRVIAGVELSSENEVRDAHILGYLLNIDHAPFQAALSEMREARTGRAQKIVAKLNAVGVDISAERVYQIAGTGSVGRPHIAQAILEKGYVNSLQEAFDRYIDNGGVAYVPRFRLEPARAIKLIHDAGGVAVLAHPGHYDGYADLIKSLAAEGLDGIETYYPDHSPALVEHLILLARTYDLATTGGSDFHRRDGDGSARIGSVRMPSEVVQQLDDRQARVRRSA